MTKNNVRVVIQFPPAAKTVELSAGSHIHHLQQYNACWYTANLLVIQVKVKMRLCAIHSRLLRASFRKNLDYNPNPGNQNLTLSWIRPTRPLNQSFKSPKRKNPRRSEGFKFVVPEPGIEPGTRGFSIPVSQC